MLDRALCVCWNLADLACVVESSRAKSLAPNLVTFNAKLGNMLWLWNIFVSGKSSNIMIILSNFSFSQLRKTCLVPRFCASGACVDNSVSIFPICAMMSISLLNLLTISYLVPKVLRYRQAIKFIAKTTLSTRNIRKIFTKLRVSNTLGAFSTDVHRNFSSAHAHKWEWDNAYS